ncbi:MAG: PilZ domain-containing protein [Gammaproteobacteria bacterium]|nr:PilZ domain-containing protein [Gammaproteobacteria bacterium]
MGLFFNKSKQDKAALPAVDSGHACAVLQHFPIGTTVHYYPEFKKNIVLETVIIGYMVNKIPVFSAQEITCEGEGAGARLSIRHERKATRLTSLSIIIPAENRGIGHLDYIRREELDRVGGLTVGNNITLMAQVNQGKTPVVQTTVNKNTKVKDSPYADVLVAILDIDVTSLLLADQRAQARLQVQLPVQIQLENEAPLPCTMADFSERSVRLRAGEDGWPADIVAGGHLSLVFRLPGRDSDTVLRGEIYRVDYIDLVLMLEEIQRDGRFRRLEVIDVLETKAKLLQLPDTSA